MAKIPDYLSSDETQSAPLDEVQISKVRDYGRKLYVE